MVFVLGVFLITVNGVGSSGLPGIAAHLDSRLTLPAAIPQIPLIYDIQKWRKFSGAAVGAVDAVADGDKADAVLTEQDLCIVARLQVLASDPAHVLGKHDADPSGLNVCHHPFPGRAFKAASRIPVVGIVDTICEAMLFSIAFEVAFLIDD